MTQPIYQNGGYMVMPLVRQVTIENREGRRVSGPYPIEQIEDAVQTCDELAQRDGAFGHRTYRG